MQKTRITSRKSKKSQRALNAKKEAAAEKFKQKPRQYVKVLFVDDRRDPFKFLSYEPENITWAKSYDEFNECIRDGKFKEYDIISVDYDLQDEKSGYMCIRSLIMAAEKNSDDIPQISIHFANETERQLIEGAVSEYKREVRRRTVIAPAKKEEEPVKPEKKRTRKKRNK